MADCTWGTTARPRDMEGASVLRQLLTTSWGDPTGKRLDPFRWAVLIIALVRKTPARGFSWAIVIAYLVRRLLERLAHTKALARVVDAVRGRGVREKYVRENAIAFDDVGYLLQRRSSLASTCSLPAIDEAKEASGDDGERQSEVGPPPAAAARAIAHDES